MSSVDFSWCKNNGYTTVLNSCTGGIIPPNDLRQNHKKTRITSSSYTDLKKCLIMTKTKANNQSAFNMDKVTNNDVDITMGGPTNIGGPGDFTLSIQKCCRRPGLKGRLQKISTGVDKKHGSFERYLARKKGWIFRCQNDNGTGNTCVNN